MRRLPGAVAAVSLLLFGAPLRAHSAGIASPSCESCHSGGQTPTVMLTTEPANPAVGEPITVTIGISQTNGPTAGFYLTTAYQVPGAFRALEAGTSATDAAVMHTMPRAGSGGITTFKAQWTASQATGVTFEVYAVSANGDKSSRGDGPATNRLDLLVGCSGGTYYIDQDGDGYGSTDPAYPPRKDCSPPPGYAALSGDCDDFRSEVHPGAPEQCDLKDNDCNGMVDDNVVSQQYCEDQDGDGHGVSGGMTKTDCKPSAGFGACDADCDDHDASVHPGTKEVCDGRDNDCNGKIDEGARMVCGVGLCSRYALGCSARCTPGEPFTETCDGYDDDCDGVTDNGTNQSLCGDPNVACVQGKCVGSPSASAGASGSGSGGGAVGPDPSGAPGARSGGSCSLAVGDVDRVGRVFSSALVLLSLLGFGRRRFRMAPLAIRISLTRR